MPATAFRPAQAACALPRAFGACAHIDPAGLQPMPRVHDLLEHLGLDPKRLSPVEALLAANYAAVHQQDLQGYDTTLLDARALTIANESSIVLSEVWKHDGVCEVELVNDAGFAVWWSFESRQKVALRNNTSRVFPRVQLSKLRVGTANGAVNPDGSATTLNNLVAIVRGDVRGIPKC